MLGETLTMLGERKGASFILVGRIIPWHSTTRVDAAANSSTRKAAAAAPGTEANNIRINIRINIRLLSKTELLVVARLLENNENNDFTPSSFS